jgi:thiamine biosynthesis lipoprotein
MSAREHIERFDCFGSTCALYVTGADQRRSAREAALQARRSLQGWHARFSRFRPDSELSRLNDDPRNEVAVSPLLARLIAATRMAAGLSDGLVDATLVGEIEDAGYEGDLGEPLPLSVALALAPERRPAQASVDAAWRRLQVDLQAGVVRRPPGVRVDSGGLAKGLFADVLAAGLRGHSSFALDCAGDIAIGGAAAAARAVQVESPFDGGTLHTFVVRSGGVATSGISRRSWLDRRGRPAHHLLDPSTGEPAFTGIVQATALAPTALEAEIRAKWALLAGPRAVAAALAHGGAIVLDDGSHRILEPPLVVDSSELSPFGGRRRSHPAGTRRLTLR